MQVNKKYRTFAVATGKGPFPMDMLRYDCCFPAKAEDAHEINSTKDFRAIALAQDHDKATGRWTPDRWASFGWILAAPFAELADARDVVQSQERTFTSP